MILGAAIFGGFMKRPAKEPSKLSDSVHHQLNMYALAASAAGVGMLALAQPVEAKIVYTKTHQVINRQNHLVNLDLNYDGIVDFALVVGNRVGGYGINLAAYPARSSTPNTVRHTSKNGVYWAAAYPAGIRIGPKRRPVRPPKNPYDGALMEHGCIKTSTCRGGSSGNWLDVENRYLGLVFVFNGKTHYGWARLGATAGHNFGVRATLTGYAYETIPNKAIITGKTKGPDVITFQPGSLGALAAGASAHSAWRVKQTTATTH
jgi:hypothetical protein